MLFFLRSSRTWKDWGKVGRSVAVLFSSMEIICIWRNTTHQRLTARNKYIERPSNNHYQRLNLSIRRRQMGQNVSIICRCSVIWVFRYFDTPCIESILDLRRKHPIWAVMQAIHIERSSNTNRVNLLKQYISYDKYDK